MTGTLAVIFVFGGLIFFHELGHFLVARFFGIGVKTFSLGFGPALITRKHGKTVYQIAALPLGGFVSLVGESADAEIPEPFNKQESFALRPAAQRFCVAAAGSIFNLLLAWILCWGLLWADGRTELPPVLGEIVEGSAAAASPMRVGDRILSIDGQPVARWSELPSLVQRNKGKALSVVLERDGAALPAFAITPTLLTHTTPDGGKIESWGMGIRPGKPEHHDFSFLSAAGEGLLEAKGMVTFTWNSLGDLVTRNVAFDNVGGPILIAQTIYQQADHGMTNVLMLAALISVNLGILNLLPIPVLDGGHLFFLLVEMIFGRPVPLKIQEKAMVVGLCMLLGLMLFATFNDVMRIVRSIFS